MAAKIQQVIQQTTDDLMRYISHTEYVYKLPDISYTNTTPFKSYTDPLLRDYRVIRLQHRINAHISCASKALNSRSPAFRLPIEIWVSILRLVVGDQDLRDPEAYYRGVQTLARVCTPFRDVILHTPCFWTLVSPSSRGRLLQTRLRRAKSSGLFFTSRGTRWPTDDFISALFENISRAQKMYFAFDSRPSGRWAEVVKTVLSSYDHPVALEDFTLAVNKPPWDSSITIPGSPLHGLAPNLKRLTLSGCYLQGAPAVFCRLQSLRLLNYQYAGPSVRQVFEMLSHYTTLRTLIITSLTFDDRQIFATPKVSLPHLQTLRLHEMSLDNADSILAHLQTPPCTQLLLEFRIETAGLEEQDSTGTLALSGSPLGTAIIASMTDTKLVTIEVGWTYTVFSTNGLSPVIEDDNDTSKGVSVQVDYQNPADILDWFTKRVYPKLGGASPPKVHVTFKESWHMSHMSSLREPLPAGSLPIGAIQISDTEERRCASCHGWFRPCKECCPPFPGAPLD